MDSRFRHTMRILGVGLVFLLGGLFLLKPSFDNVLNVSAEGGETLPAIHYDVAYERPVVLDEDKAMQLIYQAPLDVQDEAVIFTGVEVWQSNSNNLWLAMQFREVDPDVQSPRIFLAFRDSEGAAWLSGDVFLRDSTTPRADSEIQEFWFHVRFDEEMLRRDSRNKPEWFERVANSTIEVGVVKGQKIIIAGPGNETVDGESPLTYLHPVANVRLFTD